MVTISLYKKYKEYRRYLRDNATELSIFLKQFEVHLDLEENIYEQCTIKELKVLNFLLSCNLSDEDIESVLVWSNKDRGIFHDNDSKKIFQTLSGYLTGSFKSETKEEEVNSPRVVVVKILKKLKIDTEEGDTYPDNIGIDYCPKTSEDEDGNLHSQEDLNSSKNKRVKDYKSLHEKFSKQGPDIIETDSPGEKKIVPRVKCDQCGRLVPRGRIKVHIRRVHTDTRVPCPLCGKMVTQQHITGHVKTHRTENSEVFTCQVCDFSTHHKKYLRGHFRRNHRQKEFGCEICGMLFDAGAPLNRHVMNSHGDSVTCPSCPFQTRNADVLQTHINSHHSAAVVFSCIFCTFETGNSQELQSHLGFHHPEMEISALDVGSSARNTVRASKSKKETTDRPKIVYKCEYHDCKYTVGDRGSLKKHVEKKHLKILYNCEFCDHVTGLKASLKTHKLRKHPTQFKMYSCHLCSFKTQSKDLLQKHVSGLKHNF